MIRKYKDFGAGEWDTGLGKLIKKEIEDIIENEPKEDVVDSIMNLIYDTKYEW